MSLKQDKGRERRLMILLYRNAIKRYINTTKQEKLLAKQEKLVSKQEKLVAKLQKYEDKEIDNIDLLGCVIKERGICITKNEEK